MLKQIKKFMKNESGAAVVEYGLITSGISIATIPSVTGVGNKLHDLHSDPERTLTRRPLGASGCVVKSNMLRAPFRFANNKPTGARITSRRSHSGFAGVQ